MKKLFIGALLMGASLLANAQTVIRSDYSSPVPGTELGEEKVYESFDVFMLTALFPKHSFGSRVGGAFYKPGSIGWEFASSFMFKDNVVAFDLGANYALPLNQNFFLTLGLGPSLSLYQVDDKNDKYKTHTKTSLNAYVHPALLFNYKKIFMSLGYDYVAPKFKFSKKDGASGAVSIGIGWTVL